MEKQKMTIQPACDLIEEQKGLRVAPESVEVLNYRRPPTKEEKEHWATVRSEQLELLQRLNELNKQIEAMSKYSELTQIYEKYNNNIEKIMSRSTMEMLKEKMSDMFRHRNKAEQP